jgi:hypothetical protein
MKYEANERFPYARYINQTLRGMAEQLDVLKEIRFMSFWKSLLCFA